MREPREPIDPLIEPINEVLKDFVPKSGVIFPYKGPYDHQLVSPGVTFPEHELREVFEKRNGPKPHYYTQENWDSYFETWKKGHSYRHEGMTWPKLNSRSLESYDDEIPGIANKIKSETGKVVILGNGLSLVPVEIGERYLRGLVQTPPVIVDLFDPRDLYTDLIRLKEMLDEKRLPNPWEYDLLNAQSLDDAIQRGAISYVHYFVGNGDPPPEIQNADLVINCYGPSLRSLEEQVSLLSPTGEFYNDLSYDINPIPQIPGFKTDLLKRTDGRSSHKGIKITRDQ